MKKQTASDYGATIINQDYMKTSQLPRAELKPFDETGGRHTHTYTTVTKWDHHASRYTGILDYSEALEVMCSGCLERKSLEETN